MVRYDSLLLQEASDPPAPPAQRQDHHISSSSFSFSNHIYSNFFAGEATTTGRVALIGAAYELTCATFWESRKQSESHCNGDAVSRGPTADHMVPESKERKGGREPLSSCAYDSRHFFCHGRFRPGGRVSVRASGFRRAWWCVAPTQYRGPFLRETKIPQDGSEGIEMKFRIY